MPARSPSTGSSASGGGAGFPTTTAAAATPSKCRRRFRFNRLLKNGVRRRCERRGVGCKEARRGRCRGASERSADAADGPRRRNRLRWLVFCSRRFSSEKVSLRKDFLASRVAKGQPRRPHPFFSSLLSLFRQGFLHDIEVVLSVGAPVQVRRVGTRQGRLDHFVGDLQEKRVDLFGGLYCRRRGALRR